MTFTNRYRLLWKFASLLGKAKDIELEWQKIQQESHNTTFAFQSGRAIEVDEAYKKGIVEGINWCVERFS